LEAAASTKGGGSGAVGWLDEERIEALTSPLHGSAKPVTVRIGVIEEEGAKHLLLISSARQTDAPHARRQLLANVSHELRTPMNAVIGMVELALGEPQSARVRDYLETARDSSRVMLSLVDDLLDFARAESGRFELDAAPFSLRRVLDAALRSHSIRAGEKALELTSEVDPGVPDRLIGDARRFRQVVSNLVGNAVKFTDRGEVSIHVMIESRGDESVTLRTQVRDTGIGISEADQTRIFEAFTQVDPSSTRRHAGAGLGLTICREIAERMGGHVSVESTEGNGATFTAQMRFGVMKRHPGGPPKPVAELEELPVLVVDDNATNRRILEQTLRSWSMRPVAVSEARAALQLINAAVQRGQPYPLLIVDGAMPDVDGCALLTTLKDRGLIGHARVLMLSSGGPPEMDERVRNLPISAYLEKPVSQSALLDTIVEVLNGPPRRREELPGIPPTKAPLSVLVAEDTPANRKVVEAILTKRGHRFEVVSNGRDAVEHCRQKRYDAVLMDVQMPVMDGLAATVEIRSLEDRQGLPIIAMTAHAMRGDRERCLDAGMHAYVPKPISAMELLDVLETSVAQSRRRVSPVSRGFGGESTAMTPGKSVDQRDPVLNLAVARQRLGGDEELLRDLAGFFIEDAPRLLEDARLALRAGDAENATRHAHSLKGLAANFEANSTVELAQRLESSSRAQQFSDAIGLCDPLEGAVARVIDALRAQVLK
jgi:signal transduction histidine kinase/CheY-like chemotaxis protein